MTGDKTSSESVLLFTYARAVVLCGTIIAYFAPQAIDGQGDMTAPVGAVSVVANGKLYLRYMQRLLCYALVDGSNS